MSRTRLSETQISAGNPLVDESELASALNDHLNSPTAHSQYLTAEEANAAYAEINHIHATSNILHVSKVAGAGNFLTLAEAIAAATLPTSTNRYLIKVDPGIYLESPGLIIPGYVYVTGNDPWNSSIIKANDLTNDFITIAPNGGMFNIAVSGPTTAGKSAIKQIASGTTKLYWVNIKEGSYGITLAPVSGVARCHCIGVVTDGPTVMNRMFNCDNPAGVGVFILMMSGPMSGTWVGSQPSAIYLNGNGSIAPYKANATIDLCQFRGTGYDPVYADNAGLARGISCSFAQGLTAIHVGPNGASKVDFHGSQIKPGGFTKDVWCESAIGSVTYSGVATEGKIIMTPGSTFIGNFADTDPSIGGQVIYGELWIGNTTVKTPLASYIQADKNTGLVNGGGLSRGIGLLDVNVAAGLAFIDTSSGLKKVSWNSTVLTIPINIEKARIYVNNAGVVTYSASSIDKELNVQLGETGSDSTKLLFLFDQTILLPQFRPKLYEYMEKVIGPINIEGGLVTVNGTDPLKLNVEASIFFVTEVENVTASGTAITFNCWHRNGAGGWNVQTESMVDVETYDAGTGSLVNIPAGKFVRSVLYVAKNTGNTEFHFVHGQELFDAAIDAVTNPVPPTILAEHACRLAAIVTQQGAITITSILDERPRLGQMATGNTAVTKHNDLSGRESLSAHSQYQLLTEKNIANGYAGLNASGLLDNSIVPILPHGNQAGGTLHANATTSVSGFLSSADKLKLDNIATNATANSSDLVLKDRANHTGSQAISTITNLQAELDSKEIKGVLNCIQIPAISATSIIPYDNTAPLITEGTQIASVVYSPISLLSKLLIVGSLVVDSGTNNRNITLAIFKDSTCIGVVTTNVNSSGRPQILSFNISDLDLGISFGSSVTYSVRVGVNSSTTWYLNRTSTLVFNGLMDFNSIIFKEYI